MHETVIYKGLFPPARLQVLSFPFPCVHVTLSVLEEKTDPVSQKN